jgi:formate dehydrogenase accessory protein FdhD
MSAELSAIAELVSAEEGLSTARACRRLGMSRSELLRALVMLSQPPAEGGLGLIERRQEAQRETLWLTESARMARQAMADTVTHRPLADHSGERFEAEGDTLTSQTVAEMLAEETPVALLFNGIPHVVMMCTPQDLEDFALGFALSEGIIERADELEIVESLQRDDGIAVHLAIPSARMAALDDRRRNLPGRSGCGMCGAETLSEAMRPVRRVSECAAITPQRLLRGFERLGSLQPLNQRSGSLHAAAALIGDELLVREDVGRHNAVDKVIGALARNDQSADALLVTSRASYELVHKAAQFGIGTLAAVSAPTALAVRLSRQAGMTLYAFARENRLTRYQ